MSHPFVPPAPFRNGNGHFFTWHPSPLGAVSPRCGHHIRGWWFCSLTGFSPCSVPSPDFSFHADEFLEVYVSASEHPNHFWVQIIGSRSLQLDKLVNEMTQHYKNSLVGRLRGRVVSDAKRDLPCSWWYICFLFLWSSCLSFFLLALPVSCFQPTPP